MRWGKLLMLTACWAGACAAQPAGAIVLFDGSGLDEWQASGGGEPRWRVRDGALEVRPWRGSIATKRAFGDVQLHLEYLIPEGTRGRGQRRGNSGVKLMEHYEVQILDSYENETYPDGQAAALYGQHPPMVNASRPQGAWQTLDVVFRRPRFAPDGTVQHPAVVTVFHNGVLVHDHAALSGPTGGRDRGYRSHPDRLPILLQDHRDRVRFRNIWVYELE